MARVEGQPGWSDERPAASIGWSLTRASRAGEAPPGEPTRRTDFPSPLTTPRAEPNAIGAGRVGREDYTARRPTGLAMTVSDILSVVPAAEADASRYESSRRHVGVGAKPARTLAFSITRRKGSKG